MITAETLLIIVLFVLPLLLGGMLVTRKLMTLYFERRDYAEIPYSRAVIWDNSTPAKVVGPVIGYDPYEAPLVLFRDDATSAGVVLGVRPNRLTSYGQVFYTNATCTPVGEPSGYPMIRAYNANTGTGSTAPDYLYLPDGFVYQMQNISYAMGSDNILYRADNAAGENVTSNGSNLYVWTSQDLAPAGGTPSPPCAAVDNGVTVQNLAPATQVIDFDSSYYSAPFRAAFPVPGSSVALPCANNEC